MSIRIISSIIIVLILILIMLYFKKHLNIKERTGWIFSKDRKKIFKIIDAIAIIVFLVLNVIDVNYNTTSDFYPYFILGLFLFLFTTQGIEEYINYRKEKFYYYSFLCASSFIVLIIIFIFTEN